MNTIKIDDITFEIEEQVSNLIVMVSKERDQLRTELKDMEFQNDCHSGSETCDLSEGSGYPCYRHLDHEYRKLFDLNTKTLAELAKSQEEVKHVEASHLRASQENCGLIIQRNKAQAEVNRMADKWRGAEDKINEFWEDLQNSFEIESREELEAEANNWNPQNPLVVALHYIWKSDAKVGGLREALEELCCEAGDLSSHEIDGGAPDNRWEDMRIALVAAEQLLKDIDTDDSKG